MTDTEDYPLPDQAYAYGKPPLKASLRYRPEDFVVDECFELEFSGDGEFDWLWIEKRGENTSYVAKQLARIAGVSERAVSYSGLKDRRALTRQWFCVHLPGKCGRNWDDKGEWQLSDMQERSGWHVLKWGRHRQKLRPGSHRGNRFTITLNQLDGDRSEIPARLKRIARGFPNYFGEQRFGINGDNINRALAWFRGEIRPDRFQRGIYLSSARSMIFNRVLAERVAAGIWNEARDGEVFCLRDSGSVFTAELDDDILRRVREGDIHASGPLFGKAGKLVPLADVAALEASLVAQYPLLCDGLLRHGLKAERRSLRVVPVDLRAEVADQALTLRFSLIRGCFATSLVRELVDYTVTP